MCWSSTAVNAYDPMGGAYAFSPIGFSGKTAGAGDTEDARWTTAIKYRENIGDFRLSAMGQPLGYGAYNPNNGAVSGGIGGDIKHLGSRHSLVGCHRHFRERRG